MKKLILLVVLVCGNACAQSPYQVELQSYRTYLQSEIDSGRMTPEQGNYLLIAKQNELRARQSAAVNAAIGQAAAGLGMMNAAGPTPIPQNTINCQTYQRGYNGTINCQ